MMVYLQAVTIVSGSSRGRGGGDVEVVAMAVVVAAAAVVVVAVVVLDYHDYLPRLLPRPLTLIMTRYPAPE